MKLQNTCFVAEQHLLFVLSAMGTVSIHTLGCKLNFAESGALARQFESRNYRVVPFGSKADVTVINTCTVTEEADRKCRQVIRKAMRANPETFVVVTGCYAQLNPDDIACIPGVDAVLGTHEKLLLFQYLHSFQKKEKTQISVSYIDDVETFGPAYATGERTRAFLKVQDGCDYLCSFCTIPFARGKSRSSTIVDVVGQAREIAVDGFKEIVLSGVNIGLFGQDTGESLLELLRSLDTVDGVDRYRISSIEPNLLTNEIIDFVAGSERFMPHFHVPLQSGNDEILGKMKRRYRSNVYSDRVLRIKSAMPHACIGVDVIVGFPGESDSHFKTTLDFLSNLPVSYLHAFSYSERPGTAAIGIAEEPAGTPVAKGKRSRRNRLLRLLSEKRRSLFYTEHLGTQRSVLWEHTAKEGRQLGFTDNYIRIERPFEKDASGEIEIVTLSALTERGTVEVDALEFIPLA